MYVVKTSKQLVFNYNSFFRCSTTISVSASMASVFVFDLWPATMLILDLETLKKSDKVLISSLLDS